MKKILVFAFVMTLGITMLFAQTATAVSTDQATPIVKATDMGSNVKCSSEAKTGTCCAKGSADASSSAAVITTDASTNVVPVAKAGSCCAKPGADASAAKAGDEHCKSAAISTSAAKPESDKVDETPEK